MDILKKTIEAIRPVDNTRVVRPRHRRGSTYPTKPPGSLLGRLEEFASRLVAIAGDLDLWIHKKVVFTFAGDHGVVDEGVAAYPKEVTPRWSSTF